MESILVWQRNLPKCLICSAEIETGAISHDSCHDAGDMLLCRACSDAVYSSQSVDSQPTYMNNMYQHPQMPERFETRTIPQVFAPFDFNQSLARRFDTPSLPILGVDVSNGNQLLTSPDLPQVQDQVSPPGTQNWFDDDRLMPEQTDQHDHSNCSSGDEVNTMIGSMHTSTNLDSVFFKCSRSGCEDKKFGRWYDVRRHYRSVHKTREEVFWCSTTVCERSESVGDRPFPRKDKLADHVQKMHGG